MAPAELLGCLICAWGLELVKGIEKATHRASQTSLWTRFMLSGEGFKGEDKGVFCLFFVLQGIL